jgi:hypothetical protein
LSVALATGVVPSRSFVDLLLAFVGWFLLLVVPVNVAVDALSVSVVGVSDVTLVATPAVPVAVWYWWTHRSLGALGEWFFWTVALTLALGVPVMVTLAALGVAPTTGSYPARVLGVGFTAVVYSGAYALGYLGWASHLWDRVGADTRTDN